MAIYQSITIRGSVGAGGRNDSADVRTVQSQLNGLMNAPRVPLTVDGLAGPKTKAMIVDFQKNVVDLAMPDGRVDPGGKTLRALNDPGSEGKWARMSMAPPPLPGAPGSSAMPTLPAVYTASEKGFLERLYAKIGEVHTRKPAKDVLDDLVQNDIALAKALISLQGVTQYTVEFLEALANMRRAGFTAREIVILFSDARKMGLGQLDEMIGVMRLVGQNAKLAAALKGLGRVALVATLVTTFYVVIDHFRNGRFGPGMAEIYGVAMGMAVPWAGFLNAMQELIYAYNPNSANDTKIQAGFRFLLACDPIGAGKTAIDTYYTFVKMALTAMFTGKINGGELDELARRMRNSPMKFWTDIGDSMGDWMGDKFGDWYYEHFLK